MLIRKELNFVVIEVSVNEKRTKVVIEKVKKEHRHLQKVGIVSMLGETILDY